MMKSIFSKKGGEITFLAVGSLLCFICNVLYAATNRTAKNGATTMTKKIRTRVNNDNDNDTNHTMMIVNDENDSVVDDVNDALSLSLSLSLSPPLQGNSTNASKGDEVLKNEEIKSDNNDDIAAGGENENETDAVAVVDDEYVANGTVQITTNSTTNTPALNAADQKKQNTEVEERKELHQQNENVASDASITADTTSSIINNNNNSSSSSSSSPCNNITGLPLSSFVSSSSKLVRNGLPLGPKTSPKPKLTNTLLDRIIIVPEYNLFFCYIEKVGCSMINQLFRMLRLYTNPNMSLEEAKYQADSTWWRNTPKHHNLTRQDLEKIMINPNWTKAVFYREPASRFKSGYKSKCEGADGEDHHGHCKQSFGNKTINFDAALQRLETHGSIASMNPHFKPAYDFCGGLGQTIDYYDFIQEIDIETSGQHFTSLFDRIGVDSNTTHELVELVVKTGGTNNKMNANFILKQRTDISHFSKGFDSSHNTGGSNSSNAKKYYQSPKDYDIINKFYVKDYELFYNISYCQS